MTTLVETLFPGCTLGRGGSEANGLTIDAMPQNCIIIDQFHDNHYPLSERRDHYLVQVGESLASLRICKAMPGYGYEAFAYVSSVSNGELGKDALIEQFKRWKDALHLSQPLKKTN